MVERETERRVAVNTRRAGQPACGTSCRFEPARRLASGSCRPLPQARGHTPGSPGKTDWRPGHPAIRRTRPGERIRASPRRSVRPAARARGARPVSRNTDDGAGIGPVPSLEYSLHEESRRHRRRPRPYGCTLLIAVPAACGCRQSGAGISRAVSAPRSKKRVGHRGLSSDHFTWSPQPGELP